MKVLSKAIETTGRLDDRYHITLDEPLPDTQNRNVRVIVLIPDDDTISEREWLRSASGNEAFSFLSDPEEDIYSPDDGRALSA